MKHQNTRLAVAFISILFVSQARAQFNIEDRVQCTANLHVRATPSTSGMLIATQPSGSRGLIIDGPQSANGFVWWRIDWDNGYIGWSAQDFLIELTVYDLNISSSNPNNGVYIFVGPNDILGRADGTTSFLRFFDAGRSVTLIAPGTANGNNFQKWQRNGSDFSTSTTVNFTMSADYTLTAIYASPPPPTRTLIISSSNPNSGVSITGNQPDNNGNFGGTTTFTRVFNQNASVSFNAPSIAGGNNFQKWQRDGVDLTTSATATLTMDANHTITAVYASPPPPTAQTLPATSVTATSAQLNGNTDGRGLSGAVWFEWGTSSGYGSSTSAGDLGPTADSVWFTLTGLTPDTVYHYRIVASTIAGTTYGSDRTFTTGMRPSYTVATSSSPPGAGTVNGGGTVLDGQSVTVVASANPGYAFVNWTESGTPVSTSASYTFTANSSRSLVANFQSGTYACSRSNPSCGLFLVTHGWLLNEQPTEWVPEMSGAITNRLGIALPIYTVRIERVPFTFSLARLASNNPEIDINQFGGAIVILDWSDASGGIPCEDAVSTTDVADLAFQYVFGRLHAGHSLIEVPVHLIGHSRGASVMSRISYQMARAGGAWVDHFTALDPHPAGPCDWNNSSFPVYANTIFADDYYRTGAGFNGEPIDGAAIVRLNGIVTSGYDSHTDVHTYYHGSIPEDLLPGTQVDGRTILTSWYDDSLLPTRPPRFLTGFAFSRYLPDGLILRPTEGIHPDAFGTGARQAVTIASGNLAVPNIAMDDLYLSGGNYTVHVGDAVPLSYFYQDADSQVTVTFKKDNDTNPFNDPADSCHQSVGSPRTHIASPAAIQYSTFSWTPSASDVGTYYIQARITDGSYLRYDYLATPMTVVASATAPDLTVISAVGAPSQAMAGSTISIGYTLKNLGNAPSGTFGVRVSLGTTAYGTQYRLADFSTPSLSANEQRAETRMVTIPEAFAPGNYWVTVYADGPAPGVVAEADEGNNIGSSNPNQITITAPTYTIATTASPAAGGTTTGSGNYTRGASVTVMASAVVGYRFVNWTENMAEVSTSTSYSFIANASRSLMANFALIPVNISVTVETIPSGRSFEVDGTIYTTAQTFSWVAGENHTVATTSPQSAGTGARYVWTGWSDGGPVSHAVTPLNDTSYVVTFTRQHYLTMNAGTGGSVTPSSGWHNAGDPVPISAVADEGYTFTSWVGTGSSGSYSGSSSSASVRMSGPTTQTASFTALPLALRVAIVGPEIVITWPARVGRTYVVEFTDGSSAWSEFTSIMAESSPITVTDLRFNERRFYRVVRID